MVDSLADGRRFRIFTLVDNYTRECLALEVDSSLSGRRVVGVLGRVAEQRALPELLTSACYERLCQVRRPLAWCPLGGPIELEIRAAA